MQAPTARNEIAGEGLEPPIDSTPRQAHRQPAGGATRQGHRDGLTLLEVLVATAILAGALATLGEVVRLATRSAAESRDLARAQLLAASTMAELVASGVVPEPIEGGTLPNDPDPNDPSWVYSVALGTTGDPALFAVQVTITQVVPANVRPIQYSLTRWLLDPDYATADLSEEAAESQSESSDAAETL